MAHLKHRPILDVMFNPKKENIKTLYTENCTIDVLRKDKTVKDKWKIDYVEQIPETQYFQKNDKGMYDRLNFFTKETYVKGNADGYSHNYMTNKGIGYNLPAHLRIYTEKHSGLYYIFDVYCEFYNLQYNLKLIQQYIIDDDISTRTIKDGHVIYTKIIDPIAKIYSLNDAKNVVVNCKQHFGDNLYDHVKKKSKHQGHSRLQIKSPSKSKSLSSKSLSSKSKSLSSKSPSLFKSLSSKSPPLFKSRPHQTSRSKKKWKNKTQKHRN
jgi:hypothetical protein